MVISRYRPALLNVRTGVIHLGGAQRTLRRLQGFMRHCAPYAGLIWAVNLVAHCFDHHDINFPVTHAATLARLPKVCQGHQKIYLWILAQRAKVISFRPVNKTLISRCPKQPTFLPWRNSIYAAFIYRPALGHSLATRHITEKASSTRKKSSY